MKMLKWALLGGAAFAVTATAAQADELSDLKAQLETLQQRVTQLEAQPSTSLPSGYSLMSFRSGGAVYNAGPERAEMQQLTAVQNGFTIGVMPAADVAPVAEVTVSGEIRTILTYNGNDDIHGKFSAGSDGWYKNPWKHEDAYSFSEKFKIKDSDDTLDVQTRARLVVTGKAETAVGEVGGRIRIQAGNPFDDDNGAVINQAWAWWKFSPSWALYAGLWDSTAAPQAGIDWDFTGPTYTGLLGDDGSTEQIRLVFNNGGPVTFAIAVEDNESDDFCTGTSALGGITGLPGTCYQSFNSAFQDSFGVAISSSNVGNDLGDVPAVAGYIAYDSEGVFLQLTGLWEQDDRQYSYLLWSDRTYGNGGWWWNDDNELRNIFYKDNKAKDNWFVGAGARFGLGDMATLTGAAFWGEGYQDAVYTVIGPDDQYWGASLGVIANVGEASRLEIGAAYFKNKDAFFGFLDDSWQATAGWYWDPVSQVTLFVNAGYAWQTYKGGCFGIDYGNTSADDEIVSCKDDPDAFAKFHDFDQNFWQVNVGTYLRF